MISDGQVVSRLGGLLEAETNGEIVGLHIEQVACYGFNSTATRVWQLLEQPRTKAELRRILLQEFDVPADVCDRDLDELLRRLEQDRLVEMKAASA